MAYRNLDEFLVRLEQTGELIHITPTVRTNLEIAQITLDHVYASQNKALWFDSVAGSAFPVVTNLFGTPQRMAWALGLADLNELTQRLEKLLDFQPPLTFSTIMSRAGELFSILRSTHTTRHQQIPVQAVSHTDHADVTTLPILRQWADEPYPSITMAQIIMQDVETKMPVVTYGHVIVYNAKTLGIPYHPRYETAAQLTGAVVLGGDPATIWSARVSLPGIIDPHWVASWLRGKSVSLARGISQDIQFPADAEIIIEGWADPAQQQMHDSFAGYDGYYTTSEQYITFHLTAITLRKNAIYPASIISLPPSDHHLMLSAYERFLAPLFRLIMEAIADIHLPEVGSFYHLAVVSIQNRYAGLAQKVMFGLWGIGDFALNRALIIVDEGVNIRDLNTVAEAVLQYVDWQQDIIQVNGLSQRYHHIGGKIGIDATQKLCPDPTSYQPPVDSQRITEIIGNHWILWNNAVLVIVQDQSTNTEPLKQKVWAACSHCHLVFVDEATSLHNLQELGHHILVNVDWQKDLTVHDGKAVLHITSKRKPLN